MSRFHFRVPSVLILIILIAGCDTAGMSDGIVLVHTVDETVGGDPIRFAFSSSDVQSGVLTTVSCGCTLDVGGFLQSNSFSKAEILTARVTGARVKSVFPIGQRLNYLDELRLTVAGNSSGTEDIAGSDSFSNTQEKALTVTGGNTVADLVRQSGFTARIGVDPSNTMSSTDYELEVEFTIEFEMEGI